MVELWFVILGGAVLLAFGVTAVVGAPYVPSLRRDLQKAFDTLYALDSHDVLVDMGCGDGVVLREAARRGAKAVGYELNPFMTVIARIMCRRYSGVRVVQANFWRAQVPDDTTIVYTFGDSRDIERMAAWVEAQATRLGRPIYFMSYGFRLAHRQPLRSFGAHVLYEVAPLQ